MKVLRCILLIFGVVRHLAVSGVPCQAQSISGRVLVSDLEGTVQGDVPGAWVVVCRGNRLLKKQDKLQPKARFELSAESDGRSFDLVAGAADMTPTTLHGLAIEPGQKLVLNVTLQRVAEMLRAPAAGRKAVERKVAEALDALPPDSEEARSLRDMLERLNRKQTVSIVLPAYFYPGGNSMKDWEEIFWAAAQLRDDAELIVVLNVQNGPGNPLQPDPNYAEIVSRLSKAGATAVGYVNSDYGKRSETEMQRDVGAWIKAYRGVGGFFFDQVSSDRKDVPHYRSICGFARNALKGVKRPIIIGNSGALCDEGYAEEGGFDLLCIAENRWGEGKIERPDWNRPTTRAKAGVILYGLTDRKDLGTAFDQVTAEGLSFVYLTDQTGKGGEVLWTRMPGKNDIWRPLVQRVKEWNSAARATK
jgi:hypothetical protein